MNNTIFDQLDKILINAKSIIESPNLNWEQKFGLIFSQDISKVVRRLDRGFEYYDPDTTYEADTMAWYSAFVQRMDSLRPLFGAGVQQFTLPAGKVIREYLMFGVDSARIIYRTNDYARNMDFLNQLMSFIQTEFPNLPQSKIEVVQYAGRRYAGTLGLEATISISTESLEPLGFRQVDSTEQTR